MNNSFIITLIYWQTRNWRHNKEAETLCKNYGLLPLTKTFYVSKLKRKEIVALTKHFEKTFLKKTEIYNLFPLCKSCFDAVTMPKIKKGRIHQAPFEIIG